jgi:hypothetical protein
MNIPRILFVTLMLLWIGGVPPFTSRCPAQPANAGGAPERLTVLENGVADGVYRPVELGAHHRVMQKLTEVQGADGFMTVVTNSYVELATGLNVWSPANQQWVEADDEIEILADRAVARKSQHQITFSGNLNDPQGVIDMRTPDGKRLRSRVVGLAYTEADTGRSVFIAEAKDSQGVVLGRNQVLYVDAFQDVKADVRYTTTRSSFEQDVIVREQLPAPETFGLKSETTRLEIWTEFLDAPVPDKRSVNFKGEDGEDAADEILDFGRMRMGPGKAFSLGDDPGNPTPEQVHAVDVRKAWDVIENRTFLIEAVPYMEARPRLLHLPKPQASAAPNLPGKRIPTIANAKRALPASIATTKTPNRTKLQGLVRIEPQRIQPGFVMDYVEIFGTSNFTFRSDTTYYVQYTANLTGTTTLEGGAVVKYQYYSSSPAAQVKVYDTFSCKTSQYRPAIFTAAQDGSVGENVSGNYPDITGINGLCYLYFINNSSSVVLGNVHFRYATLACTFENGTGHILRHAQFVNCSSALRLNSTELSARNILIHNGKNAAYSYASTLRGEHLTVRNITPSGPYANAFDTLCCLSSYHYVTNSLLIGISSIGNISGAFNATNSTPGQVFGQVGPGTSYLADGSPYLNAGTTNINSQLLADIKQRTTSPPIWLTNKVTTSITLGPTVPLDLDGPDLGYHYDPLDYICGRLEVEGISSSWANLTFNNVSAIGLYGNASYGTTSSEAGLYVKGFGRINIQGTAGRMTQVVPLMAVQDQWDYNMGGPFVMIGENDSMGGSKSVSLRFCSFSSLASQNYHLNFGLSPMSAMDSQFYGGIIKHCYQQTYPFSVNVLTLTNCVLEKLNAYLGHYAGSCGNITLRNNLLKGMGLWVYTTDPNGSTVTRDIQDNFFDTVTINQSGTITTHGYNGYISSTRITPNASTDVLPSSFPYASGALGPYYQASTNLINLGSRSASAAGLFHYTTQVSQSKEANSTVDIGFHYVALDANGNPIDSDNDGTPDYHEDANGDGIWNSGETDWQQALDTRFRVLITEPKSNSNLP